MKREVQSVLENPGRVADQHLPSTFELAKLTAILAGAENYKDWKLSDVVLEATSIWETCEDFQQAQKDRQILISTAGKVWDTEGLFGPAARKSRKGACGYITSEAWLKKLQRYKGHKGDLFFGLFFASVPLDVFLKELFPNSKIPKQQRFEKLMEAGKLGYASQFIGGLAEFLLRDEPPAEKELLLKAIEANEPESGEKWLKKHKIDSSIPYGPAPELFYTLQNLREGSFFGIMFGSVPALLCRWLIHVHQQNLSTVRSNASRNKSKCLPPKTTECADKAKDSVK